MEVKKIYLRKKVRQWQTDIKFFKKKPTETRSRKWIHSKSSSIKNIPFNENKLKNGYLKNANPPCLWPATASLLPRKPPSMTAQRLLGEESPRYLCVGDVASEQFGNTNVQDRVSESHYWTWVSGSFPGFLSLPLEPAGAGGSSASQWAWLSPWTPEPLAGVEYLNLKKAFTSWRFFVVVVVLFPCSIRFYF